jgi:hypothetical protein
MSQEIFVFVKIFIYLKIAKNGENWRKYGKN